MIVGHIGGGGGGYEILKSVRVRLSATGYLNRTFPVAGNRQTWTFSGWVKRGTLGSFQGIFGGGSTTPAYDAIRFSDTDTIQIYTGGAASVLVATSAVFRDPSAHYHIVVVFDTTQATVADRIKLYVNGVRQTLTGTFPNQSTTWNINNNNAHAIAAQTFSGTYVGTLDGYVAEIYFSDGVAYGPTDFGEFNIDGVWVPKKFTGIYGTNGFYLPFSDGTSLANLTADKSGNGNNWTANNISLTAGTTYDWMEDTPTNNFATLNPLDYINGTYSNGNLSHAGAQFDGRGSIAMSSGKWYWEVTLGVVGSTATEYVGVLINSYNATTASSWTTYRAYISTGQKTNGTPTAYGASYTVNDVIGVALDVTNGTIEFFKNGVSQGVAFSDLAGIEWKSVTYASTSTTSTLHTNFGQRPFTYAPPTGFKALCTKNLPAVAISNPKKHFDVLLHIGTDGVAGSVSGSQFQPDFVWGKRRGVTGSHGLFDSARGVSKWLASDLTSAETTASGVTAFNSDGYSYGTGSLLSNGAVASWLWKAGGAAVANTDGTITSQVSANPLAGFSIVTYTGTGANATVGHGLGVAPKLVIVKNRGGVDGWAVYHSDQNAAPASGYTALNETSAFAATPVVWNSTPPTSALLSVGTSSRVNEAARGFVAYCFAEVPGFSKIGKYTGSGSADGPFVHCGFRPRFVLIKSSSAIGGWTLLDAARSETNAMTRKLQPQSSAAEVDPTSDLIDFTANGFKLRGTGLDSNTNGGSYIFLAIAEQPFNAPSNAR